MSERKVGASLSIIAGLIIFIWWFSSEFGLAGLLFYDCWRGFCLVLMIPGVISLILLVVGFINLIKSRETIKKSPEN